MNSTPNSVLLVFNTVELYKRILLDAVDPVPTEPCRALFVLRGVNRRTRALIDDDAEMQRLMWLAPSSATSTAACARWGCRFLANLGLAPPIDQSASISWPKQGGGLEITEVIELQSMSVNIDYESTPVKSLCSLHQLPEAHKDALWRRILFNTGPVDNTIITITRVPLQVTWRLELTSDEANKSRLYRNSDTGIAT